MKQPRPVKLVRELRRKQTDAEGRIWARLRNSGFDGVKFRRQHPLGKYVVDFITLDNKLIIEIDGGQHNDPAKIAEDKLRTQFLEKKGYRVIRFWNSDIFENLDGVLEKIHEALSKGLHPHL